MDATQRQGINIGRGALQAIFAVFLGLMITAVVGVGVYTFYPSPAQQTQEQIDELYQQRADIEACGKELVGQCRTWDQLTPEEQAQIRQIDARASDLQRTLTEQNRTWSQRTSIILVVIATALMATSLLLGEAVAVMSNGILLGGLFTMLYGVGWGLASGNSVTRFVVLLAALLVSLGLGYVKFVRRRPSAEATATTGAAVPPPVDAGEAADRAALSELAARVDELERRLATAAAWLGGRTTGEPPAGAPQGDQPTAGGA